jgi:hypothetical protein
MVGGIVQAVECLTIKHKALSSSPTITQKKELNFLKE